MPSVLIIDDSETVRGQIVRTLRQHLLFDRYLEAADGLEGFKALLHGKVDIILCDLEMPRMDGFKFISLLHAREEFRDIPVIMLTGRGDRELKIKGLEQGACDYVTKPFDAGELVARVRVQLKIKGLQDELRRSNELLQELSVTDHQTGLHNRRYFTEALEREFRRSLRTKDPLSLAVIDLDHFKRVNDTYGHQEGDTVLAEVAAFIKKEIRRYDIAARYGGEEFVVVLPETSLQQALQFAERCRAGIQRLAFSGRIEELAVTASLGIATYPSAPVDSAESLFGEADKALYRAKTNGRNRIEAAAG